MRKIAFLLLFVMLAFVGCSGVAGSVDFGGSQGTTTDFGGSETGMDISDNPQSFDVFDNQGKPYIPDPDNTGALNCEIMDILFVIDNSCSMIDEQELLSSNFPIFAEQLEMLVEENSSLHIGVITTDDYDHNPEGCRTLGALVTQHETEDDTIVPCGPFVDGYNFMTENDDLSDSFVCAASVGSGGGGNEQALEGMIQALEGFLNSPGKCNDGFNRPSTLTTAIIVTDEDTYADIGNSYDHMLYLEGAEENISIISIIPTNGDIVNCGYTPTNLIEFTNMFTNGKIINMCQSSWSNILTEAADTIAEACGRLPGEYPPEQ